MLLKHPYHDPLTPADVEAELPPGCEPSSLPVMVAQPAASFDPAVTGYKVFLPPGTRQAPKLEPIANDPDLTFEIVQPTSVPGTGYVKAVSADGTDSRSYRVEFVHKVAARLSSGDKSRAGETLTVNYRLQNLDPAAQAQQITIRYDEKALEFTEAIPLTEGIAVTDEDRTVPGQLKLVVSGLGASNAVTEDGGPLRLNFRTLTSGKTTIRLEQVTFAAATGLEREADTADLQVVVRGSGGMNQK